jgi:uncharacterized protein YigE (DUF2233 family)
MLIIDGAIHPAFLENSTDRKMRNGVGLTSPTEVHFVITKDRVSFYDFARFFRDGLGCRNALGIYTERLSTERLEAGRNLFIE